MNKLVAKMIKKTDYTSYCCLHVMASHRRNALYAVGVFAKCVMDIVSSAEKIPQKIDLLNAWQQELDNIYQNNAPTSQIGRDIFAILQNFNLPKSEFMMLLNSARNDLLNPPRGLSQQLYGKYCDERAGVFIRQVLRILGCNDEICINQLANYLGKALQTTFFLRDIKDDALNGRIYLPFDYLRDAGINSCNPMEIIVDNNLGKARDRLGKFAKNNFIKAFDLLNNLDKKTAFHLKMLVYPYKYCFDAMDSRGWEIITPKPDVTPFTKIMLFFKAYMEKVF